MWSTSWEGVKLAAVAYLLPFLWCYNEALVLVGSPVEIVYVAVTSVVAAFLLARGAQIFRARKAREFSLGLLMFIATLVVGGRTVWIGAQNPATLAVAAGGVA